jgi:hypothetical protein
VEEDFEHGELLLWHHRRDKATTATATGTATGTATATAFFSSLLRVAGGLASARWRTATTGTTNTTGWLVCSQNVEELHVEHAPLAVGQVPAHAPSHGHEQPRLQNGLRLPPLHPAVPLLSRGGEVLTAIDMRAPTPTTVLALVTTRWLFIINISVSVFI